MHRNYLDWRKGAPFQEAKASCLRVLWHREQANRRDRTKASEAGACDTELERG